MHIFYYKKDFKLAYKSLPPFHMKEMLIPGIISGTLSLFGGILVIQSVIYLGQAIGFSVVQGAIIVAGLWGVFYFEEIQEREKITMWFLNASISLVGMLLLIS